MLILYYDNGNWPIFRNCFNESGVTCRASYRCRFLPSILFRINRLLRFDWKTIDRMAFYYPKDGENNLIVVFDATIRDGYLQILREKNPNAEIVVWCWNEINPEGRLLEEAEGLDIWSYSPHDCETYGLRYLPQFYFDSVVNRFAQDQAALEPQGKKGFLFMGREKGRGSQIDAIADRIRASGWDCQVEYLQQRRFGDRSGHRSVIPYDSAIRKTLDYRGILDIAASETSGLSLRAMEAAFFHRKLITTNPVVKEYDFYDENNIYVWEQNDMTLDEFLKRPYRPVPREIMNQYLLSNWAAKIQAAYGANQIKMEPGCL